jgi:hypothetical protein
MREIIFEENYKYIQEELGRNRRNKGTDIGEKIN